MRLSLGPDGPTMLYNTFKAPLAPPTSVSDSYQYAIGDVWRCEDMHWFWDGDEWVRWTGDEQRHPFYNNVMLYETSNGSVRWKVVTE